MSDSYIADQTLKGVKSIEKGDYENCRFINCILPKYDLTGIRFVDCEFENCDLSSCTLYDTSFNDVIFRDSKLLGLRFEACNAFLFSINFSGSNLNFSSFFQMNPKSLSFRDCDLREVDFTGANLTETLFEECDLDSAIFQNTILKKADFRSSFNFRIDPEVNRIDQAKFSLQSLPGLLGKYNLRIE